MNNITSDNTTRAWVYIASSTRAPRPLAPSLPALLLPGRPSPHHAHAHAHAGLLLGGMLLGLAGAPPFSLVLLGLTAVCLPSLLDVALSSLLLLLGLVVVCPPSLLDVALSSLLLLLGLAAACLPLLQGAAGASLLLQRRPLRGMAPSSTSSHRRAVLFACCVGPPRWSIC